ncbi:glycoside hydrolase family 5 protein [Xylophilus sp. GOD-11R]|uniref:glycoside hydrolase family 5 protein n=1 Tax=Xylophilus sp. GOD-11R TaxID=3089814 RepID=UPI00298CC45C|nr:cellulase family glycosylhydrolase [Xylophilus sp. GOD-11R]WPB56372.1 cellulase family glycosylhydrolase [Xylophilus sp. GOD-11R]
MKAIPENGEKRSAASPGRRLFLSVAATSVGALASACGSSTEPGVTAAQELGDPRAADPQPDDPRTAAEYLAAMHLGSQAGDYLEMPYLPAGLPNAVGAADFLRMRQEAGLDHVRIPANCAARADVDGVISESFLKLLDTQILLALAQFPRVVLDALHHYLQWKGDHTYDASFDDHERVAPLTAAQHAVRATAIWRQLALRYQAYTTRLSFDLFNEPSQTQQGAFPPGLSAAQLDEWHAGVVGVIRATGGVNAQRMIWFEPWGNRLELLTLPADSGPHGVSPHYYTPSGFTMGSVPLTAAGLADYVADVRYAQAWAASRQVALWIGESGVSRNVPQRTEPRTPADRAEFIAHVRNTAYGLGVPVCVWGYNSNFALFDQAHGTWLPSMLQATTALPAPYPVRSVPPFQTLAGGRIARIFWSNSLWAGFSYDAASGVLHAQENQTDQVQRITLVFPDMAVASEQSWITRATAFEGYWQVGTAPYYFDATAQDQNGVHGLDLRAMTPQGKDIYPVYMPVAPGGFDNAYGPIGSEGNYLGIDLGFDAGSPSGSIALACLRSL